MKFKKQMNGIEFSSLLELICITMIQIYNRIETEEKNGIPYLKKREREEKHSIEFPVSRPIYRNRY